MNKVFSMFGLSFSHSTAQFSTPFPGAEETTYTLRSDSSSKWSYTTHPSFEMEVHRVAEHTQIDFNANLKKNKHKLRVDKKTQEDWESID